MPDLPRDLRTLYKEGRVVPFVGAGVSMSVSWNMGSISLRGISWSQLVEQAMEELGFDRPDLLRARGTDLQILEYYRAVKGNFTELTNWMVRNLNPPDAELVASRLHTALASLRRCDLFYTTNFDAMLERSLRLAGRDVHVLATERDMGVRHACEVVKFHGDLNNPDKMVLSESDYERRLSLGTPMDFRLRSDLMNRAALFAGYSFRDYNVSYLFRVINDASGPLTNTLHGRRAYIIFADPSEFERRLFSERNIEIIPVSGRDMSSSVAEVLEELATI